MKVTGLRVFHVLPRWTLLAVDTDAGITGYGEPVVEGQSRIVEQAVLQLGEYLVGKDPRHIERHWQAMYRGSFYRGGPVWVSAISGIEQALWDITGKFHDAPVYDLLGGPVRDTVRMYGHTHPAGDTDADYAAEVAAHQARGMTAVKVGIDGPVRGVDTLDYVERQASRFAAMREAVGPRFDIAIDFHGRTSPAMAKRLIEAIEPYHPMFVEEPCLPENVDAMVDVARSTTVPIATGERRFTKFEFRELIEKRAVAILQPDLCHAGGISEVRKIAAMGEASYLSLAPHNPLGPVSLAACLQVDACTSNFLIQEHPAIEGGADLGHGLLRNPFVIEDGSIRLPTGPGLGIEVDEDALRERAYDGAWLSPVFADPDGSHGDW
jgi:galactonate dehydratase